MATYTMAWDVGAVGGGVLLGFVIDATSYSFGFVVVGVLPIAGLALYLVRVAQGDREGDLYYMNASSVATEVAGPPQRSYYSPCDQRRHREGHPCDHKHREHHMTK